MIPPVPYRASEAIREVVDQLLAEHHLSREIPIPVDLIAERAGLDLIPIPGFRARAGAEGALSTDRTAIYFDERGAEVNLARHRFTIGHELGHFLLHQPQLEAVDAEDIEDWKAAVRAIDEHSYSRLEFQAQEFAGQLLVPADVLHREYLSAAAEARAAGLVLAELGEYSLRTVAESIGRRFLVSGDVVYIRLQLEGMIARRRS